MLLIRSFSMQQAPWFPVQRELAYLFDVGDQLYRSTCQVLPIRSDCPFCERETYATPYLRATSQHPLFGYYGSAAGH